MKIIKKLLTLALAAGLSLSAAALTASAAELPVYGIGFVDATSLRLRSAPDTQAPVTATAPQNDCVVVLSQEDGWYKVSFDLQEGYMSAEFLQVSTCENAELGYGSVNGTGVNLRSGPGTQYPSVGRANSGEKYYIIGLNNGWYKLLREGSACYIRSDYMTLTEIPYENQASANSPQYFRHGASIAALPSARAAQEQAPAVRASGPEILAEAQKYLGTRYVNGGASPSGFDCSGFVYYVLKQCGYAPYRTPADQYQQGEAVDKSQLQPGDIVFFSGTYASGISHVGIYAGDGRFIHAPNSRSTVSYSDLTSGYWAEHYYGARRMG